jgi:hypothetical protein
VSHLYLVPVGDDWISEFDRHVTNPVDLASESIDELEDLQEARVWGTTAGPRNRKYYESLDSGDPLLFYHDGEFFASGRVGRVFENSEVGDRLWGNPDSRFIYTVEDFAEISLPRHELNSILGYDDNYAPQGFLRVSADATSALLQEFNSVEEAFQAFRDGYSTGGDSPDDPDPAPEEDSEDDVREHTEIQHYLVELGLKHNYDVYVATNDQNLEFEGQRLGENCVDNLNLAGFSDATMRIIEYVDVIWMDGDYIAKMFEVESTTSIYSGILRMTDFVVKVPNLAVDMFIVAPDDDEEKVRREMNRPTFQRVLEPAEHCSLQFVSFNGVRDKHELVEQAGPLQDVF